MSFRHVLIDDIIISDRQRKKMEGKPLGELRDSIITNGLLHAIVVSELEDRKLRLVVGGRRLHVIRQLHVDEIDVKHGKVAILSGTIPATVLDGKALSSLLQMEYDENAVRVDLEWQEAAEAIAAIHEQKVKEAAEVGKVHTKVDTAKLLVDLAAKDVSGLPTLKVPTAKANVTRSVVLAEALPHRPDLARAKSAGEAYKILLREGEERFQAELTRRKLSSIKESDRLWDLRLGNAKDILVTLPDGMVDLVLVDPPYGIGINKEKYAASTLHRYDDSEQYARDLCVFIIQETWRLTKTRANLFMFCKWKSFGVIQESAAQFGWDIWPDPLVWRKSHAEGEAPWGRLGFIKTYELLLWVSKGQKGITGPLTDVLDFPKVASRSRIHGAEKPLVLLEYLIEKASMVGDLVLDPCAGSGTTLLAAARKKRRSIGIELDETYHNRAMSRMSNFESGKPDEDLEKEPTNDGTESGNGEPS